MRRSIAGCAGGGSTRLRPSCVELPATGRGIRVFTEEIASSRRGDFRAVCCDFRRDLFDSRFGYNRYLFAWQGNALLFQQCNY